MILATVDPVRLLIFITTILVFSPALRKLLSRMKL
jgi:hypothetical protein